MPRSCEPRSKRCCPTQRVTSSGLNARGATTTNPLSVACRQRIESGLAQAPARVARYVRDYEKTPTFVRAFAHGAGRGIGTLLDYFGPGWRALVRNNRDLGNLLATAVQFRLPITFRQRKDSLGWGYDPTALIAFDPTSTIYPSGNLTAPWGTLTVERGGVLLRNEFSTIRVGAPSATVAADIKQLTGDGWTLSLEPGWRIAPDPTKSGSYVVVRYQ